MQRTLAEEVPLDKPVWDVHNHASRGLEAGARFGDLREDMAQRPNWDQDIAEIDLSEVRPENL
jgi:hypothetical protein